LAVAILGSGLAQLTAAANPLSGHDCTEHAGTAASIAG